MLRVKVDTTQSLKTFTENTYAQAAFYWNALLREKGIKVNDRRINADCTVYEGDIVSYYLTPKQADKRAFFLVYQDENVCIVDKESGVNSEAVFAELQRQGECYFIHRLDRNTKGLLVFALKEEAAKVLLRAFKERRVEKRYHALCFGHFEKESACLTAYLKKDSSKALVRVYDKQTANAEKIITEYRVIERFAEYTKVEILLHTGKTHQIRAHFAHIGNPVVGDMKYGIPEKNKGLAARQCLVAKYLRFSFEGEFSYLNDFQWASRFEAEIEKKV